MMLVTLITATLAFVIQWVLFSMINAHVAVYAFLSFALCGLIFTFTFNFLERTKIDNYFTIFILILGIMLIDHVLFGAIIEGELLSSSLFVRAVYILVLPAMLSKNVFGTITPPKANEKVKSKMKK